MHIAHAAVIRKEKQRKFQRIWQRDIFVLTMILRLCMYAVCLLFSFFSFIRLLIYGLVIGKVEMSMRMREKTKMTFNT